jgi:hypothetical protein
VDRYLVISHMYTLNRCRSAWPGLIPDESLFAVVGSSDYGNRHLRDVPPCLAGGLWSGWSWPRGKPSGKDGLESLPFPLFSARAEVVWFAYRGIFVDSLSRL